MDAWGIGPFDNDDATQLAYEAKQFPTLVLLGDALREIALEESDWFEASITWRAIAAAEIVAALRGQPCSTIPPILTLWIEEHRHQDLSGLIPLAADIVGKVRHGGEVYDLWAESEKLDEWQVVLDDLAERLGTDPGDYVGKSYE